MKRNSRIIFRHSFGQFIEDNVEPPEAGMQCVLIGSGRDRGERLGSFFEPKLKQEICDWRNRSLNGTVGEACPCAKYVSHGVSDAEMAQRATTNFDQQAADEIAEAVATMRRALSGSEAAICRMFESSPPFTLAALNAAAQELREIRAEQIRSRMVEFFQSRYCNSERAEEFSRAVLQSLPYLHTNGTTSNVWSPAQAFAMLGGYRPDRHGPWMVGVDLT